MLGNVGFSEFAAPLLARSLLWPIAVAQNCYSGGNFKTFLKTCPRLRPIARTFDSVRPNLARTKGAFWSQPSPTTEQAIWAKTFPLMQAYAVRSKSTNFGMVTHLREKRFVRRPEILLAPMDAHDA